MLPRLLLLVFLFRSSSGYSAGAPLSQCGDMHPNYFLHGFSSSSSGADRYYNISVSSSTYFDEPVKVTIEAFEDDYKFKGFLLQARFKDSPDEGAVGTFSDELPPQTKILQCSDEAHGVTHNPKGSHKSLTFIWQPPKNTKSDIVFYATIVKELRYYWVQHKSEPITFKEKEIVEEEIEEDKEEQGGETKPKPTPTQISKPESEEEKPVGENKEELIETPLKEKKLKGKEGSRRREGERRKKGDKKRKGRGKKNEEKRRRKDKRKNKKRKEETRMLPG